MAKIVVTRPIAENGLNLLRNAGHEVIVHDDWLMNEDQLKEFVVGAEVILCLLTDPVTDAVMEAAGSQFKLIATYNVGYDNIDLHAAKRRGLTVTSTAGFISSIAVAEHAFALMFAVARMVRPADNYVRGGNYHYWNPNLFTGQQLRGKTVGIIGTGQIGSLFATMCAEGLNMEVLYTDVMQSMPLEMTLGAKKVELNELLQRSDVVSIHVPLLPSTTGMISHEQLGMMKNTAVLVNTARGPIIDEEALVQALRERKIWGAGLDVFKYEPYLAGGMQELDNVVVTPHIASATAPTREGMSDNVARNILAVLEGKTPPCPVKLPAD
jgi:lactate dehydrogenase-like 2-hydroxyacid dehydrogenase